HEERTLMKKRYHVARTRLTNLLNSMHDDVLSTDQKRDSLKKELNEYHQTDRFENCETMGQVLRLHLDLMLGKPKPKKPDVLATYKV
ncbi:MAG: hypothetical protein R3333_11575, partial [Lishizhenia sp.]|nr:hypothetical protein [Lishizhenia sp.]